jgi:mannonate dehydratase
MRLSMLLKPVPDRSWALAAQMGVMAAISKFAPELTGGEAADMPGVLDRGRARFAEAGFTLVGLEGDQFDMSRIKLGLPGRDDDLARYVTMLRAAGAAGIGLMCVNFMAGTGWFRTESHAPGRGGAGVSRFRAADAATLPPAVPEPVGAEAIWSNLATFLAAVVPEAERQGIVLALHPDDPPVPSLRGVARVLISAAAMERAVALVPSPALRLTFCQGSLAAAGEDVIATARRFAAAGLIGFVHVRDIRGTAEDFVETFPEEGMTDMPVLFRAYAEAGLTVPIRPDHAPTMAGDAALALGYQGGPTVGYEPTGMVYTLGYMRGLMDAAGVGVA